jgi:hypothetical protein
VKCAVLYYITVHTQCIVCDEMALTSLTLWLRDDATRSRSCPVPVMSHPAAANDVLDGATGSQRPIQSTISAGVGWAHSPLSERAALVSTAVRFVKPDRSAMMIYLLLCTVLAARPRDDGRFIERYIHSRARFCNEFRGLPG